ncbi:transcriptional activator of glycolytic enzymes-domain-containing protein [Phycomyces blakesleeanus]
MASGECEQTTAARSFLELLKQLRITFLQDSAVLMKKIPSHPLWHNGIFSDPEYTEFRRSVDHFVELNIRPADLVIHRAMEIMERRMQDMETNFINHMNAMSREVNFLSGRIGDLVSGRVPIMMHRPHGNEWIEQPGQANRPPSQVPPPSQNIAFQQAPVHQFPPPQELPPQAPPPQAPPSQAPPPPAPPLQAPPLQAPPLQAPPSQAPPPQAQALHIPPSSKQLIFRHTPVPKPHVPKSSARKVSARKSSASQTSARTQHVTFRHTTVPPPSNSTTKGVQTITELWKEWHTGLFGGFPVYEMETRFGDSLKEGDRQSFNIRKKIVECIKEYAVNNSISEEKAVELAEENRKTRKKTMDFLSKNTDHIY